MKYSENDKLVFFNRPFIFELIIIFLLLSVLLDVLGVCITGSDETVDRVFLVTAFSMTAICVLAMFLTLWSGKLTTVKIYNDRIEWRARFRKQTIPLEKAKIREEKPSVFIYEYGAGMVTVYSDETKGVRICLRHLKQLNRMLAIMPPCELYEFIADKARKSEEKLFEDFTVQKSDLQEQPTEKSIKFINNKISVILTVVWAVFGFAVLLLLTFPEFFSVWELITAIACLTLFITAAVAARRLWSGTMGVVCFNEKGILFSLRFKKTFVSYDDMDIERSIWDGYDEVLIKWRVKYKIADKNDPSHAVTIKFRNPQLICEILNVIPDSRLRDLLKSDISETKKHGERV